MKKQKRVKSPLYLMTDYSDRKNLVAVQFQNGIGNFIMMTPAIQAFAELHNAKVDIVFDSSWKNSRKKEVVEMCELWPLVNRAYDFQEGFKKEDYVGLLFAYHGETSEAFSFFKENADTDSEHVDWRMEKQNEVDYYMDIVWKMGYRGDTPPVYCPVGTKAMVSNDLANTTYARIGISNGYFAGSRWKWERKGYPYYQELVTLLNRYFESRVKIFLFGKGESDAAWADSIVANNVVNLVDRCTFADSCAVLKYMDLMITTDTSMMHAADALGIPMVAIFGPTILSKNGPYNKEHRIVRSHMSCAPCQLSANFHICNKWDCMEVLTPDIVMSEVRRYVYDLVRRGKFREKLDIDWGIKRCLKVQLNREKLYSATREL